MWYSKIYLGKKSYQTKLGKTGCSNVILTTYTDYWFGLKNFFGISILIIK